jgi:tellurium resistance protein TerD
LSELFLGLGWECDGAIDLDASVILFNHNNDIVGEVFYGHKEEQGIKHSGDNTTGEGKGDDEVIRFKLNMIPKSIHKIVCTVNIYSDG